MKLRKAIIVLAVLSAVLAAAPRVYTTSPPAGHAFSEYTDVASHWASAYIEKLANCDAFDDLPPLWHPDSPILRGQFARYLARGWGIPPYTGTEQFFEDVPPTHPYYPFVNALYVRGLMIGSGGKFGVDDPLTRAQAATLLVRASGLEEAARGRDADEARGVIMGYHDGTKVPEWAIPYVAQASQSHLFEGDNAGNFRPNDPLTKAEAAAIIIRLDTNQPLYDFGDAPDDPENGFFFPSTLAHGGARVKDYSLAWLGKSVDGEVDSCQVNADRFDDGYFGFEAVGTAAPLWHVNFKFSVADRSLFVGTVGAAATNGGEPLHRLYFNLLVDTDQSMNWEPDEWLVKDQLIDVSAVPAWDGSTILTTRDPIDSTSFLLPDANVNPAKCWFRMVLTVDQKIGDTAGAAGPAVGGGPAGQLGIWTGLGEFNSGEVEDYGPEEQKIDILKDILNLADQWSNGEYDGKGNDPQPGSPVAGPNAPTNVPPMMGTAAVAYSLNDIGPLVQRLVDAEQGDAPIDVLVDLKKQILDRLYEAAEQAHRTNLAAANTTELDNLWRKMAFVMEEEVKRYIIALLDSVLKTSSLSANTVGMFEGIRGQILELMKAQEKGEPNEALLAQKDRIIGQLESLIATLKETGQTGPLATAEEALRWVRFLKSVEAPANPGNTAGGSYEDPTHGRPTGQPGGPEGDTPSLEGLEPLAGAESCSVVGGESFFYLDPKLFGAGWVFDAEIYDAHQPWPPGTMATGAQDSPDWTGSDFKGGVRFDRTSPQPLGEVFRFGYDVNCLDYDWMVIILTGKDHERLGYVPSPRVWTGVLKLKEEMSPNLDIFFDPDTPYSSGYWDIMLAFQASGGQTGGQTPGTGGQGPAPGQGKTGEEVPTLLANTAYGGGIVRLADGLGDLRDGQRAPETGYSGAAEGIAVGDYYVLKAADGQGYALLYVRAVGSDFVTLAVEYNYWGTMFPCELGPTWPAE